MLSGLVLSLAFQKIAYRGIGQSGDRYCIASQLFKKNCVKLILVSQMIPDAYVEKVIVHGREAVCNIVQDDSQAEV